MDKNTVEAARKLYKFFKTHGWTKHKLASNKYDCVTDIYSPDAVNFCLFGAAQKLKISRYLVIKIAQSKNDWGTGWNDMFANKGLFMSALKRKAQL